jgi:cell division protein FtsI (penicillin-binding protein 3)
VLFYDYIRRFGFGEKSLIDLPGEDPGLIRPPRQWSALSHDSLTIGQEITVTPIQLITAFAAIANGGWLMRPRMVTRIVQGDSERIVEPKVRQRMLLQQTAAQLTAILVGVVERGTGKQAALEGYTVAGKTGTAQKTETGGYSRRKLLASFVGYVPAEAPELVILAMIDEPQKDRWGGTAAAPMFKRVAQQALHYLQVPPQRARPLTLEALRAEN